MGQPIELARPSVANASGGGQATRPDTLFGIPVLFDETGAAVPASALYGAAVVALYDAVSGKAIGTGNALPVNVVTGVSDKTATGTITATTPTNVALTGGGLGAVSVVITGTWTGTLHFQVSGDGTNWVDVEASPPGGGPPVTTTTGNGTWSIQAGGFNAVRVFGPTATGTATVTLASTLVTDNVALIGPFGARTSALSLPVVLASDQAALPVTTTVANAGTGTQTSVALTGASQTILAANTNRLGAMVYNDSTTTLNLLLTTGGTASATAFTVQLAAAGYYELPYHYVGAIIGFSGAASGNARVTELTA